jgi:uncharacterized membrane protein
MYHSLSMPAAESDRPFRLNDRLEAFSDGVFSIVITLLVIELALPHLEDPRSTSEMFGALWSLNSRFVSFVICFMFVGQLWMAHTNFFRLVARTDDVVIWLNLLLLMFVCLQPFVTTILGEYPENPGSVMVFGVLFTATGAVFGPLSWYCQSRRLYHPAVDVARLKRGLRFAATLEVMSLVPLAFAYASPALAMLCYVGFIVGYILNQTQFRVRVSSEEGRA